MGKANSANRNPSERTTDAGVQSFGNPKNSSDLALPLILTFLDFTEQFGGDGQTWTTIHGIGRSN